MTAVTAVTGDRPAAAVLPELDVEGPAAPPRTNGELVFAEPWQGRAFGLAMTLTDQGVVTYDAFREALIARIAAHEEQPDDQPYSYYRCWLEALEQLLDEQALVPRAELDARSAAFAVRPPGHDHAGHGHDHEDDDHHHG